MNMTTITEGGAHIRVDRILAMPINGPLSKVGLHIGKENIGKTTLHLYPAEAIRIADCLIQIAKAAAMDEFERKQAAE